MLQLRMGAIPVTSPVFTKTILQNTLLNLEPCVVIPVNLQETPSIGRRLTRLEGFQAFNTPRVA